MLNWLRFVGTAKSRSNLERGRELSAVEALEPRTLLAVVAADNVVWRGMPMEVRENSWILTFDRQLGRDVAAQQAAIIAESMGLQVDQIVGSPLGRFANIFTRTRITESMADTAKSRFGLLRQVEPDGLMFPTAIPNDARYGEQWALNNTGQTEVDSGTGQPAAGVVGADMDAERAWNISTGDTRVVIAVIDTGIDYTHPDLANNIWTNPGEIAGNGVDDDGNGFIDDIHGWDFVGNGQGGGMGDNDPTDPVDPGHGTSVAGTIGAVGNNGIGVAGTAWNVQMIALKVGGDGPGGLPTFASNASLEYCILMKGRGVNIVATNNSYGALRPEDFGNFDTAQEVAIQDSTDAGILFVAAAGNDANDNDSGIRAFPASYTNPDIIVAAASNNRDGLASFSNYGLTTVDVAAPGEQVLTTEVGGGYRLINGTSFASPYTTGVVAMIASVNRFLTKVEIKQALYGGVDRLASFEGRVVTGGRVNLFRSIIGAQFPGPLVSGINPGAQTAPISQIRVAFSKDIQDPSNFALNLIDGISLRRSNGDSRFDANDITVDIASVSITARELIINLVTPTSRDLHRLVLDHTYFRDTDGRFLNGDFATGNDEIYDFNVVAFRGPLEPNDDFAQASPVLLDGAGRGEFNDLIIGDGLNEATDVDMFRVFASGPSLITAQITARGLTIPSELDSFLRLFDASGVELARNDNFNGLDSKIQFFVPAAGQYYIGVSAYPNANYNPQNENSGLPSDALGNFNILVQVQTSSTEQTSRTNSTIVPIPTTGIITSTIVVTDGRTVADVNVRVNIEHSFVGDLLITLTGPSGTVITLFNQRGGSGDNFTSTVFDDEAVTPVTAGAAPYSGSFRPEVLLNDLDNASAAGTWTLTIQDNKAGDSGRLLDWSIDLTLTNDVFGPFEVNDTSFIATDTTIVGSGSRTFSAFIGDGAFGLRDVDIFRFNAGAGTTITSIGTPTTTGLDLILRLFDADGNELVIDKRRGSSAAAINYVVASAGIFFLGVSGGNTTSDTDFGNDAYTIDLGGSGTPTDATGNYTISLTVSGGISEGQVVLTGNNLAVGVNSNGAIGYSNNGTPAGIALNGTEFLLNGGDIDSYFGVSLDGFIVRNAADGSQSDFSVSVANESDYGNRRVVATGAFRNIGLRRVLSFGASDKFVAVDVTLRNLSLTPINNLAWMEGFNAEQGFNGSNLSRNTVNNVRNAAPRFATASLSGGLTFGIAAPPSATNAIASFEERGTLRDPFQVINTPLDPDATGDAGASNDRDMALAFNLGSLGPDQFVTFRYFIFADTSLANVLAAYNDMADSDAGPGHLTPDAQQPELDTEGLPSLPFKTYYPEGFANSRASTFLPIINGAGEAGRVVVIARYEGSASADVLYDSFTDSASGEFAATRRGGITLTTPALYAAGSDSRVLSEVRNATSSVLRNGVRKDTPYAIEVRSSTPVGAILSHYDFGIATGDSFTSQLSTTWTLGEGTKGAGINDFVVFYNPSPSTVKVTLTVYPANGAAPFQSVRTIAGQRRGGWSIADFPTSQIPNGKVAFKLDAEAPIIAALTHFDTNDQSGYSTLALSGAGTLSGGTADGEIGVGASSEEIAILNPNGSSASVTFTFSFANGSSFRKQLNVAGQRRATLNVNSLAGFPSGQPYAVSYSSTLPIAVNLTSFTQDEAAGSGLSARAASQWLFAEGFRPAAGSAVTEYLRVYNPSATDTTIEISIDFSNGESEVFRRTLPARAGTNFNIHDFVTGSRRNADAFYGIKVQSAVPIVAFAGHFDEFLGGGFGTLGTPLGATGSVS